MVNDANFLRGRSAALTASASADSNGRLVGAAILSAASLLGVYLGLITWAQGSEHAFDQLRTDFWFIAPISAGFGLQVGLFLWLRRLHAHSASGAALAAGSTGVSAGAMLACCAHHLTDVLPLLGASGLALFLNDTKTPIAWSGIALNALGIGYMLFRIRQFRCSKAAAASRGEEAKA